VTLNPRSGIYLVEDEIERTWTIYFVGRVPYRWQGRHAGQRVVVLFNAERHFWSMGSGHIALDNSRCNETEHSII
jgi:hypothetical protein